jgi:hypothetical protein
VSAALTEKGPRAPRRARRRPGLLAGDDDLSATVAAVAAALGVEPLMREPFAHEAVLKLDAGGDERPPAGRQAGGCTAVGRRRFEPTKPSSRSAWRRSPATTTIAPPRTPTGT